MVVINKLSTRWKQTEQLMQKNREPRNKHKYTWELINDKRDILCGWEKGLFSQNQIVLGQQIRPLEKIKARSLYHSLQQN